MLKNKETFLQLPYKPVGMCMYMSVCGRGMEGEEETETERKKMIKQM